MKPVSSLSALIAGVAILVPLWSSDAQAIDLKVRNVVKVQPRIAVKPKINVAPKVAVKPKVKLKPNVAVKLRVKAAPKVAVKPKVKVTPNIAAKLKIKVAPKVTAAPRIRAVPVPAPRPMAPQINPGTNLAKIPAPQPRIPVPAPAARGGNIGATNLAGKLGNIHLDAGARDAAAAAEAARNLVDMKDLRAGATAKFDLDVPDLGGNGSQGNQERLGGMTGRNGSGFGFGDDLGSGASLPGAMGGTHSGKTPHNPFAVTPESIADGMGGVAGQRTVRLPLRKEVNHSDDRLSGASNGSVGSTDLFKRRPDGTTTLVHEEHNVLEDMHTRQHIERGRDGNVTEDSGPQPIENETAGTSATELRNPDHVGGNPDCWGIDCVVGSSQPKGLITKKTDKNQVLTAGPEHANPNEAGGTPAISLEQLLSRYDNDLTGGSTPTPIDTKGPCQDC